MGVILYDKVYILRQKTRQKLVKNMGARPKWVPLEDNASEVTYLRSGGNRAQAFSFFSLYKSL